MVSEQKAKLVKVTSIFLIIVLVVDAIYVINKITMARGNISFGYYLHAVISLTWALLVTLAITPWGNATSLYNNI